MADSEFILSLEYDSVVEHFHELLITHPVLLLLDGLDQLTNAHFARSRLSFLRGIRLHSRSCLVVSCLPDGPPGECYTHSLTSNLLSCVVLK